MGSGLCALRLFLLVLASVCLTLQSYLIISPQTPLGKHCPTAKIQWVRDLPSTGTTPEPVRLMKVRKPVTGEIEFVQCRCAEKKAAEASEKKMLQTRFEIQPTLFFYEDCAMPDVPECEVPSNARAHLESVDYQSWSPTPLTPPPLLS